MTAKKELNKGLTLIEVLISVLIFTVLVGVVTDLFVSSIRMQSRILTEQKISGEISYVLEYMGRALRMAKRADNDNCITTDHNYSHEDGGVQFLNYQGKCQRFFLEDGIIKEQKSSTGSWFDFGSSVALTSSAFNVEELQFNNAGSDWFPAGIASGNQSKVAILILMRSRTDEGAFMKIQTTVSQRKINVPATAQSE